MGLVPPIHVATTFIRDPDNGYRSGNVYGSADNETVRLAERILAALDGADDAMLFGSGMAAATSVFLALPEPCHIVASEVMYWGLRSWLGGISKLGHSITFVETSDLAALQSAIRPGQTKLVWIETPSNPLWTITDIEAVADATHAVGAILCVDSTVATPVLTRPLALGADIVMHSATKYLNGHSDVVAGSLATLEKSAFWFDIKKVRQAYGNALGSFEAWLLTRGMRTLDLRVRAQSLSAQVLSERLTDHPLITQVLYPGLPSHRGYDIARHQMTGGFGGMLSIRMKSGAAGAIAAAANVKLWKRATSLGGVESLIEHRYSIEGQGSPCPADLLRLSVGLEDVDDLYSDLLQALRLTAT